MESTPKITTRSQTDKVDKQAAADLFSGVDETMELDGDQ